MKAYGLPRFSWIEYPDQSDLKKFALKSSIGYLKKKGGDYPTCMRSNQKQKFRRLYKSRERQRVKMFINLELNNEIFTEGYKNV